MKLVLVGAGGFVGAILRYVISGWVQRLPFGETFPTGTLVVNVTGCLAIGVLSELAEARGVLTPEIRALLVVGVLGAYTTFSAFANESLNLFRDREAGLALLNVALSLGSCFIAVWAGRWAAHALWG
ncbi:MAG TPA: fluoride efflux transporter CrcB [Candidatus Polarisedimenticolia bacterium]|nr:fluoride efflux transporter CrcB [Candidatus Polarisedimenticolia bacterium]